MRKEVSTTVAVVVIVLAVAVVAGVLYVRTSAARTAEASDPKYTQGGQLKGLFNNPKALAALKQRIAEERAKSGR
jgi:hypothetical protein